MTGKKLKCGAPLLNCKECIAGARTQEILAIESKEKKFSAWVQGHEVETIAVLAKFDVKIVESSPRKIFMKHTNGC